MPPYNEHISDTVNFLKEKGIHNPTAGIILGTGLNSLVDHISIIHSIPYSDIPHFPVSSVEFHKGHLIYGKIGNIHILAMQGRFHYYEGHSMIQITYPVRIMKHLGIQTLLLSNAAGGMNPAFRKGDLVLIEDHINLLPDNPLRGLDDPELGPRFVDMSGPYSPALRQRIKHFASAKNIPMQEGVYVAVMGPNLETRAEYRFLRAIGADMVGMSTVPEVIVANQIGLPCAAVSVITDECDPDNLQPVNIDEIIEVAAKADEKLSDLFATVIMSDE
jgi:purine-nucleoside phosphorylase